MAAGPVLIQETQKTLRPKGAIRSTLAGVLLGLLLAELVLRSISTVHPLPPPVTESGWDPSNVTHKYTLKQYSEGIATSHFGADSSRLSGNSPLPSAETVVLLGDSYVEAAQIEDAETIGAILERVSRTDGKGFNVRQYGWPGAGPAFYVAAAEPLARLNAKHVVVVLNYNDLGQQNFSSRFFKFDKDFQLVPNPDQPSKNRFRLWIQNNSVLVWTVVTRVKELRSLRQEQSHSANGPSREEITRAAMRQLASSYGSRLVVAYLGPDNISGADDTPLASVCSELSVRCVDLSGPMRRDRRPWRGFNNTTLGVGHLNSYGTSKAAEIIWEALR